MISTMTYSDPLRLSLRHLMNQKAEWNTYSIQQTCKGFVRSVPLARWLETELSRTNRLWKCLWDQDELGQCLAPNSNFWKRVTSLWKGCFSISYTRCCTLFASSVRPICTGETLTWHPFRCSWCVHASRSPSRPSLLTKISKAPFGMESTESLPVP